MQICYQNEFKIHPLKNDVSRNSVHCLDTSTLHILKYFWRYKHFCMYLAFSSSQTEETKIWPLLRQAYVFFFFASWITFQNYEQTKPNNHHQKKPFILQGETLAQELSGKIHFFKSRRNQCWNTAKCNCRNIIDYI